jgi:hypothetical protein
MPLDGPLCIYPSWLGLSIRITIAWCWYGTRRIYKVVNGESTRRAGGRGHDGGKGKQRHKAKALRVCALCGRVSDAERRAATHWRIGAWGVPTTCADMIAGRLAWSSDSPAVIILTTQSGCSKARLKPALCWCPCAMQGVRAKSSKLAA